MKIPLTLTARDGGNAGNARNIYLPAPLPLGEGLKSLNHESLLPLEGVAKGDKYAGYRTGGVSTRRWQQVCFPKP